MFLGGRVFLGRRHGKTRGSGIRLRLRNKMKEVN